MGTIDVGELLYEYNVEFTGMEVAAMPTFVLVHGAFGSSAELAPVIPELEAPGHRAIAVDLPCTDPRRCSRPATRAAERQSR